MARVECMSCGDMFPVADHRNAPIQCPECEKDLGPFGQCDSSGRAYTGLSEEEDRGEEASG